MKTRGAALVVVLASLALLALLAVSFATVTATERRVALAERVGGRLDPGGQGRLR